MSNRGSNLTLLQLGILAALLWALANADAELVQVTATFQHRTENGSLIQGDSPRYAKGAWIKVAGFADSRYFYGQVQLLEKHKVVGYLYVTPSPPKHEPLLPSEQDFPKPQPDSIRQEQIYVYGEVIRPGVFRVSDQRGTLYRLLAIEDHR